MSCVHEQGFVHRDLKPDNVLVIEEDRKLSSKILDFGLVGRHTKAEDTRTLTGTGDLLGTVLYMAPECFQQAQHLPSVDMYAIGCMLYEMLSGSPPFDGDSPVAIALKHNKGDIPALNSIIGTAEERVYLETVIKQSCSKNPAHRPTCEQLSQSLQCALQGDFQTEKIVVATDTHTNTNAGADKSLLRRHTAAIATFLASCAALAVFLFHPSALLTGGSVVDLQAHLAKARQELKDRHDVQAATILKEYMLNPKLKARDKFEAQMLLVETSIHRRTMELAQTQLVAAIDTLSTLEPPILDAQSTRGA